MARPNSSLSAAPGPAPAPPDPARKADHGEKGDADGGCGGPGALGLSTVWAGMGGGAVIRGTTYRRRTTELVRALERMLGPSKGVSRRGGGGARNGACRARNVVLRQAAELMRTLVRDEEVLARIHFLGGLPAAVY
jgi:hypothetical protein